MWDQEVLAALPHDAHPMGMLVGSICALSSFHPDANPALQVQFHHVFEFSMYAIIFSYHIVFCPKDGLSVQFSVGMRSVMNDFD